MELPTLTAYDTNGVGARTTLIRTWRMLWVVGLLILSGCFRVSGNSTYSGPPQRPDSMNQYYSPSQSYRGFREDIEHTTDDYTHKRITIDSYAGPIQVDYFQATKPSDSLVLVFPVLGGKNFIEKHMARYFVESGLDAAIVNRSNEFKDPTKFDELEDVFRMNIIRDRLAISFFEAEYGKRQFGTFGISRGAINVALTAGVDSRLTYNVLVMGGTDLVDLFRDSNQARIEKYIKSVSENKGFTEEEFFAALRKQLKTDPKNTAKYIDSKNTLLILGIFDKTVPFTYGLRLREQIGRPETVFLFADHYLGLLFTQTVSFIPPSKEETGIFPFPYIEQEAVSFYKRSFGDGFNWKLLPFRIVQFPLNLVAEGVAEVGSAIEWLFTSSDEKPEASTDDEGPWKPA
jgi:hypothetical protein